MAWPQMPRLPFDLAEAVVQQDVGGAGVIRARVGADHRVEAEHRLDRLRLEPVLQPVGGAAREQPEQVAPRGHVEPLQLIPALDKQREEIA